MQRTDFSYDLPPALIAQHPLPERSGSRLLFLDGLTGTRSHHSFREFPDFIGPDDLLVFNNTRVIPARLVAASEPLDENLYLAARRWRMSAPANHRKPGRS